MVKLDQWEELVVLFNRRNDFFSLDDMLLHHFPLMGIELSFFIDDIPGDLKLTDIMDECPENEGTALIAAEFQPVAHFGRKAYASRMDVWEGSDRTNRRLMKERREGYSECSLVDGSLASFLEAEEPSPCFPKNF
jgi:hypothetical protein